MKYKIGDKVKLTSPKLFKGKIGIIKKPDIGGVLHDYDWIVDVEGEPVPVWETELVPA